MNIYVILSSFLSGAAASMGLGGGSVLIIYLTMFEQMSQKQAQGINLAFFIPIALYGIISYKKAGLIEFKSLLPVILAALPGAAAGFLLLWGIKADFLRGLFAVFLIIMGIVQLFSKKKTAQQNS